MEARKPVYVDAELHRKLAILATRRASRLYLVAEEAIARYIGEEWNKKAAK